MTTTYDHLDVAIDDGVLRVTLSRPDRLNALNPTMVDELRHLFTDLYWRRDARVVVLTGAGRAFCSGLDLKERKAAKPRPTGRHLDSQRSISEIVIAMRRCPQPIIALLNGPASGGGFALALASDIRLGVPEAKMNAAFIRVGLSACDIGVSYFLPRMVGASVAAHYLLSGRFLDAQRAADLGLISLCADRAALESEGQALVRDLLAATPLGLRLTKDALNHAIDAQNLEAVVAMEDRNQILCARDPNFHEGIAAFLEKRAPNYSAGDEA